MRDLVAMRDVYVSHPAAPTVKTVPIDVSAHARVNQFVNRRKFVVSEMFYSYLRHYMSSGVHHPAVAKHDDVQGKGTLSSAEAYFKDTQSTHSRKNRLLLAIISHFTKSGCIKYTRMIDWLVYADVLLQFYSINRTNANFFDCCFYTERVETMYDS